MNGVGWAVILRTLRLVFLVVLDHFLDDESQKALGEVRVQIGLTRQVFEAFDLSRFAAWVGRRKVMCGLETANGLGVFEPFTQRIDKDRVKPVDALAMFAENFGCAGCVVSQWPIPSV